MCSRWFLLAIIMSGSVTIRMAVKLYGLITSVGIFFQTMKILKFRMFIVRSKSQRKVEEIPA